MIHQTAREYLLSGNDRHFHIDSDAAHKQVFSSCMRCLMAIGIRANFKWSQKPECLDYAARSWSWHLTSTPFDCRKVLAASKVLRVLIQASKHLSQYSANQKEHDEARGEEDRHIVKRELIDCWAVDFVKVVGNFGTIYKLIPPFCAQNSAIYQQFGETKDKSLLVSGLSTGNWDDSLARMSFGFGTYASSISAAGVQIAILVSSISVILYDSSIFEEATANPIKHGERVYRMEMNSTGTLLATYGYRTTKVWHISNGDCKVSVDNIDSRPRPLAKSLKLSGTRTI